MDIQRRPSSFAFWRRAGARRLALAASVLALSGAALTLGLQARPVALRAKSGSVVLATVERGALELEVRASGLLVPSEIRWVAAQSEGRVERIAVQAGAQLSEGQVLLVLANPQLQQRAEESHWLLEQTEAELKALRVTLENLELNQQAAIQRADLLAQSARLQWEADQELLKDGMVSKLAFQRSAFNVKQAEQTLQLERQLLLQHRSSMRAQLEAKQASLARLSKAWQRDLELVAALTVRAPMAGTLQELNLQVGQSVASGSNLAKLAKADALYAELQVQEAQARDLAPGQAALLDLRSGGVEAPLAGVVARVAPRVSNGVVKVDVAIQDALPRGARPDLSLDGTIAIARLPDSLQVQRPAFSQAQSTASVFRIAADGLAERVQVQFGPASVSRIAVRSGLAAGDRIVVSDTSGWRQADRVRID